MSETQKTKRIRRDRKLTAAEAGKYQRLRKQVEQDKGAIVARLRARQAIAELLQSLKSARESSGLSLQDVTDSSGMDRSAVAKLENGLRENPTLETLYRYADAIGKKVTVTLSDR